MATNTNHTASQTNDHATTERHSPEPGKFDKVRDMIKNYLFEIGLIVAGLITILALQASGFHGAFVYDDDMGKIVGIFNLVIMAYPLILAIMYRNGLRIGIIVVTIVFAFFAVPFLVRLFGAIASATWLIPFFGSIIIPVAAVFLNMVAAYLLLDHRPQGLGETVHDKARINGLQQSIDEAQRKYDSAKNSAASHEEIEKEAKAKLEESDEKSKASAKVYKSAKKVYDLAPASLKLAKIKDDPEKNRKAQEEVRRQIEDKQSKVDRVTPNAKIQLQAELAALDEELPVLEAELNKLNKELDALKEKIESGPEKLAMDEALAASKIDTDATLKDQEAFESANKLARKADRKMGVASRILEKSEQDLDNAHIHNTEAKKAQQGGWRSVVFGPIIALIGAFGFYPVWYGWVLVTFH